MGTIVTILLSVGLLAPPQGVQNPKTTYGIFGPARDSTKYLPGDEVVLSFDFINPQVNSAGKVAYKIGIEVEDENGKPIYKLPARAQEQAAPPAGKPMPAYALLQIGLDQPPGKHKIKVTLSQDGPGGMGVVSFTSPCEILPRDFGIVRLHATLDQEAQASTATVPLNKPAWLNFSLVGFGRSQGKEQPEISGTLTVKHGGETIATVKASTEQIAAVVPPRAQGVPLQYQLKLPKAGKYTLLLEAIDHVTNKKATAELPIEVLEK